MIIELEVSSKSLNIKQAFRMILEKCGSLNQSKDLQTNLNFAGRGGGIKQVRFEKITIF